MWFLIAHLYTVQYALDILFVKTRRKKKNREIFKLNSKLEDERSTMYVPALRS